MKTYEYETWGARTSHDWGEAGWSVTQRSDSPLFVWTAQTGMGITCGSSATAEDAQAHARWTAVESLNFDESNARPFRVRGTETLKTVEDYRG